MKILHLSIIIFSFMLVLSSSQIVFGSQQNTTDGYIHYGPSHQFISSYLVSPQYNPTLEEQFGNPTIIKLIHNGTILILNQTTQKLVYKMGENIPISTELLNIGNKTVDIAYWEPWVLLEIKNQTGVVWPKSTLIGFIPEFHGKKTLQPGEHLSKQPWGPNMFPQLYIPGNYTVMSVALFTFNTHTKSLDSIEPLWSKPLQIIVLPEKYIQNETGSSIPKIPEFPFAIPILLASFVSAIVFYRIVIRK